MIVINEAELPNSVPSAKINKKNHDILAFAMPKEVGWPGSSHLTRATSHIRHGSAAAIARH